MSTQSLTVELDDMWCRQWAQSPEMRLCFAIAVGSGGTSYANVVAHTAAIAPTTTITWIEKYQMAACPTNVIQGAYFDIESDQIDVSLGSITTVDKNWKISTDSSNIEVPKDSLVFRTETVAAAVLYQEVNGAFVPIYVTNMGSMPPHSTETLTPKDKVFVWFSSDAQHTTMFDGMQTERQEINMGGELAAAIKYNAEGSWDPLSPTVVPATTTPVAGTK